MSIRTSLVRFFLAASIGAALAGCATESEPEFGSSVRHMITGQSYNTGAAPGSTAPAMDAERAGIAVRNYRTDKNATAPAPASALVIPVSQ